jgi:penicillin-binding protein 2
LASREFLKNPKLEERYFRARVYVVAFLVICCLFVLGARMFHLQIVSNEHYATLSQENRVRVVPIAPTRGLIFDRNLKLLADNKSSYQIEITPVQVDDLQQVVAQLGEYIELEEHHLKKFYEDVKRKQSFESIPLKINLNENEVAKFSVNRHRFPGVEITARANRYYPFSGMSVHALGYVGRINAQEAQKVDKQDYRGTTHIGKVGVEKYYEDILHGEVGYQHIEINAQGRKLRVLEKVPPTAGADLVLSIDARLQKVAQESLGDRNGSVVAMDPVTGEVLVFVSTPTFDPNLFVNGISTKQYSMLRDDGDRPLFNRALRGQYPPGSTIKPMMALAGLNYGAITASETIYAGPFYILPGHKRKYRDWKKSGHGKVDMYKSIIQSCDVYFYALAVELGITKISDFLTQFNLGSRTELDTWGEVKGLMPSVQWKKAVYGQPWYPGETVITGIGQGYMLTTPLQLAVATSAIAMRGQGVRPRFLHSTRSQDETPELAAITAMPSIELNSDLYWDQVISAMIDVAHKPNGTAFKIGKDAKYKIAGKTGTAQVFGLAEDEEYEEENVAEKLRDHGLFIAFAPADDPKIAIAVIVENGGGGSKSAAPVAKVVMDHYLLSKEELVATYETKNKPLQNKKTTAPNSVPVRPAVN